MKARTRWAQVRVLYILNIDYRKKVEQFGMIGEYIIAT